MVSSQTYACHLWDAKDENDTWSSTIDLLCSLDSVTVKALEISHSTSATYQKHFLLFQYTNWH